jgi:sugar/nucleoside kinase (ribokinase family)
MLYDAFAGSCDPMLPISKIEVELDHADHRNSALHMNAPIDLLGLGSVAVDDLIYVDAYPPADTKVRVLDRERQCGGLTATALVAASRLNCRCAYAGIMGMDEDSEFALATLAKAGVFVSLAGRSPDRKIFHSTIIVDRAGTRTLLTDARDVQGAGEDWPGETVIRACKVLFVDHVGMAGMVRAARIARSAGIPVVADIERSEMDLFDELMGLIDHLIVPWEFAAAATGRKTPDAAAAALWSNDRHAVVVTCGEAGSWYIGPDRLSIHQEAYRVNVVDTTGCGDVFHGGYAAGLVRGLDLASCVQLASAAAALKATRRGGQSGCPSLAEVEAFLSKNGSPHF